MRTFGVCTFIQNSFIKVHKDYQVVLPIRRFSLATVTMSYGGAGAKTNCKPSTVDRNKRVVDMRSDTVLRNILCYSKRICINLTFKPGDEAEQGHARSNGERRGR